MSLIEAREGQEVWKFREGTSDYDITYHRHELEGSVTWRVRKYYKETNNYTTSVIVIYSRVRLLERWRSELIEEILIWADL